MLKIRIDAKWRFNPISTVDLVVYENYLTADKKKKLVVILVLPWFPEVSLGFIVNPYVTRIGAVFVQLVSTNKCAMSSQQHFDFHSPSGFFFI